MEYVSEGQKLLMNDFWGRIYLPIGIWLLLVIILIGGLVVKYSFGNWTPERKNPYETETLGLPRGLFRAILTLTLLFITVMFELANLYSGAASEDNFIQWLTAFQMMIAFYFGSKVMHHITSTDRHKAKFETEQKTQLMASQMSTTTAPVSGNQSEEFYDEEAAG